VTDTHCPYCALQCGMTLVRTGGQVTVQPRDFPTSGGGLCRKGWAAADLLDVPDRLTTPLVRAGKGEPLRPASWAAALDRVVAEIGRVQRRYGRDAVGVFGGGGLTNEKAYLLGKFARVALGTANIDYNGRFCMSSAAAAVNRSFGVDRGLPFPLTDVAGADAVLLAGGNLAETMPPLTRHLAGMRERGGALIVVDPRRTATARLADLHLQITPGTDLALANGLLHLAVRAGHVDTAYLAARTTGWDGVRQVAARYWPERVERITGVPVPELRRAAELLAAGRRYVLTGRGAEQHSAGTDTVSAFINLALALGLPGRPRSGYGCVTGQGNGQGGREHGQKADQLPGYRRIDDPAARRHVAGVWGVDPASLPGPGLSAYELLAALGTAGGPRALLVFGSNPAVSAPRAGAVRAGLSRLDFLAVADFVQSETCEYADVVLPTTQWAEEDGTMTNLEGRVIRRRRALPPPAGVRTDLAILSGLAARLGHAAGFPPIPEAVFAELGRASAGGVADYSGLDYHRLTPDGGTGHRGGADGGPSGAGGGPNGGSNGGTGGGHRADRGGSAGEGTDEGAADGAGADGAGGAIEGAFWPCPAAPAGQRPTPTPRLFLDRFGTPDGRARFVPVRHRPVAEDTDPDYPTYLTTGRMLMHYQSGAQTRRIPVLAAAAPGPYVELHPQLAARLRVADGQPVRVTSRRGSTIAPARLSEEIRLDTVFMPFHFPGVNDVTSDALDPVSRMPAFKVCAVRVEPA
jgi:assimilatory nitrate reductase catalytic subunit